MTLERFWVIRLALARARQDEYRDTSVVIFSPFH
jgi:hypothetical protein